MKSELPKIESKKCSERYKLLKEMIPHYTPEWAGSDPKDSGIALLKIFSNINENVINRLNQAPKKNFVAFLDMLGIRLLPAKPAEAPLTFNLAKGTDTEILIPERTQVSAEKTTEHEELPFETGQDLLATPSQLKTVVSVDPLIDAIYIPPPSFLNGEMQKQNQIIYNIVSSPSAGSDTFQLDNVTDLKPGDFLSIGDTDHAYVIISEISGMIIHLTDPLSKDYPSGTPVEKVTKFNLFEGKNMQEHSLYLGHKDLFNIKSKAQFTLFINHRAGTEGTLAPFKISWEYWGEIEGEESVDWRKFNTVDGTFGLSKTGTVILNKITEGEIKEKEVNGVKSRWIRCILVESLGIDASLPILDNIVFKINSSGENLALDQAFNNDKPIDVTKPFAPFGNEPRVFDNFSMASNEVFSKKGAKIKIDVEVEKRGICGSPTAILYDETKIKVFARGTSGRLIEVETDTNNGKETWTDHGFPPDTKIASEAIPSAVTLGNLRYVFARAENGHLVERFYNGTQWQWIDCGIPKEGVNVTFDPGAALAFVFVTGSDGQLYEFIPHLGKWITHKVLSDKIGSSPHVCLYQDNVAHLESNVNAIESRIISLRYRAKIFVKGKNGNLYELDCNVIDASDDKGWIDYGLPDADSKVEVASRPFAVLYSSSVGPAASNSVFAKVYVIGSSDGKESSDRALWGLDTKNSNWKLFGVPDSATNTSIDSDPHGYKANDQTNHIFIKGSDNSLWEYIDRSTGGLNWISHQRPANSKLILSPFVLYADDNIVHIFSASDKNSIVERIIIRDVWNEYRDPDETVLSPELSWEYWNGKGWVVIKGIKDRTANFLKSGEITFDLPEDIEATEVAGQKSYWIRARLVSGDYGKETFILLQDRSSEPERQQLISTKNSIRPPIVDSLEISYALETTRYPDKNITYNNLEYIDQTEASKIEDNFFLPFVKLEDKVRSLYLGFENSFKGAPIKIFFAAKELTFTEELKPKLEWTYSAKTGWNALDNQDDTEGLIKADILELLMDLDFSAQSRFGSYFYWIKGSLNEGKYEESPLLDGIFPNTAWALQAGTIKDEILGSSDGTVNQNFSFINLPVLPGQDVRVNEILTEEEKQAIIALLGEDAIKEVKDEKGKVVENWVQWFEVPDFFDSKRQDRHYTLDHATGQLQFGDGINGMIPQALDNNIRAFSYQSGGGKKGNVEAGEIKSLKSNIAGVDSVLNRVAADGGADTADLDQMLEIGPTMISHRDRAVTAKDFELLAKQASRKVVKVKCLPNTNNKNQKEIGWVTLIIVPDSKEDKPLPSLELRKEVQQYLEARCENTLACKKHIHIDSPSYVEINVSVDVFVTSIDEAFKIDREVKRKLNTFFHPLTGGREQKGWDFGRDVAASDIYALLENIEGVDHVENLKVTAAGGEPVKVEENYLVTNGTHVINLGLMDGSDPCESA